LDYDLASEEERAKVRKEFDKLNLDLSFPKVFIGERVISGYRPEEYDKVLSES
jgi:hypothetical protein